MRPDPTRVSRGPVLGFLVVVALLFGLALASMAAHAQPVTFGGYTPCGVEATGVDPWLRDKANPQGKVVTGARPGMAVSPEGRWFVCQGWVGQGGDPRTPEPSPDKVCSARDTYEFWEVAGRTCSSVPPGEYSGGTVKLAETPAGRVRYITSNPEWVRMGKATWGHVMYRCVVRPNGSTAWQVEPDAVCRWANE